MKDGTLRNDGRWWHEGQVRCEWCEELPEQCGRCRRVQESEEREYDLENRRD